MAVIIVFHRSNGNYQKRKVNSNGDCYNCHQKSHYSQDYQFPDQRIKISNSTLRQYENQKLLHPNARTKKAMEHSNNSEPKSFVPGYTVLVLVIKENIEILEKPNEA